MSTYRYLLFFKPFGVLSSFTDPEDRPTLKDFIDVPGVYPAGRLDYDSEGLLALSDDGGFLHFLTEPRHAVPKTYYVLVEGDITPGALEQLRQGVIVKGSTTRPAEVEPMPDPQLPERSKPVTPHGPTHWLKIVLREGRKRQVRHMTAAVGLPTLRLVRWAIGPVTCEGLRPGQWRNLRPEELHALQALREKPGRRLARKPRRRGPRTV